jgi:hypothetical protein
LTLIFADTGAYGPGVHEQVLTEQFLALFFSKDTTPEISDGEHLADNNDVVAVAGAAALKPNPATLRLEQARVAPSYRA